MRLRGEDAGKKLPFSLQQKLDSILSHNESGKHRVAILELGVRKNQREYCEMGKRKSHNVSLTDTFSEAKFSIFLLLYPILSPNSSTNK